MSYSEKQRQYNDKYDAENMIAKGMELVNVLGERASETTAIAAQVESSISELQNEILVIDEFVETITVISKQTNLSLVTKVCVFIQERHWKERC